MYLIEDTYGTRQIAWSWREAVSWLAAAGPVACIRNRITGRVLALRTWSRA